MQFEISAPSNSSMMDLLWQMVLCQQSLLVWEAQLTSSSSVEPAMMMIKMVIQLSPVVSALLPPLPDALVYKLLTLGIIINYR